MPYIWRFLKPQTRKAMIKLANKPVSEINIPFHVYPGKTLKYDKYLKKMEPKNKKLFRKLRKTYKNI
jgi:O-glycosyl hydrolase